MILTQLFSQPIGFLFGVLGTIIHFRSNGKSRWRAKDATLTSHYCENTLSTCWKNLSKSPCKWKLIIWSCFQQMDELEKCLENLHSVLSCDNHCIGTSGPSHFLHSNIKESIHAYSCLLRYKQQLEKEQYVLEKFMQMQKEYHLVSELHAVNLSLTTWINFLLRSSRLRETLFISAATFSIFGINETSKWNYFATKNAQCWSQQMKLTVNKSMGLARFYLLHILIETKRVYWDRLVSSFL